jgi:hypothetical protein
LCQFIETIGHVLRGHNGFLSCHKINLLVYKKGEEKLHQLIKLTKSFI